MGRSWGRPMPKGAGRGGRGGGAPSPARPAVLRSAPGDSATPEPQVTAAVLDALAVQAGKSEEVSKGLAALATVVADQGASLVASNLALAGFQKDGQDLLAALLGRIEATERSVASASAAAAAAVPAAAPVVAAVGDHDVLREMWLYHRQGSRPRAQLKCVSGARRSQTHGLVWSGKDCLLDRRS